jgi:hypothetical protein
MTLPVSRRCLGPEVLPAKIANSKRPNENGPAWEFDAHEAVHWAQQLSVQRVALVNVPGQPLRAS